MATNLNLDENTLNYLDQIAIYYALSGRSAAVRFLVREKIVDMASKSRNRPARARGRKNGKS